MIEDVSSGVGMGMVEAGVATAVCSGAAMGELIPVVVVERWDEERMNHLAAYIPLQLVHCLCLEGLKVGPSFPVLDGSTCWQFIGPYILALM